ncbi:MAG: SAM-dependent methyltransferase [Polyangiales bacterium]
MTRRGPAGGKRGGHGRKTQSGRAPEPARGPRRARTDHAKGPHGQSTGSRHGQAARTEHPGGPRRPRPEHATGSRHAARTEQSGGPRRGPGQPAPHEPPPIDARQVDQALNHAPLLPRTGEWLWTLREGAERDLIEELIAAKPGGALRPRRFAPALVISAAAPPLREDRLDVTFARQGFQVASVVRAESDDIGELVTGLAPTWERLRAEHPQHALHVFVPDSTLGNEQSSRAQALRDTLTGGAAGDAELLDDAQLRRHGGAIIHVCLCEPRAAAIGCTPADRALSLWPGGRARMRLGGDFPSRAARKLAEAFAWLGVTPGAGELCVDLGAAPGGWSWLLLEKKARVIAVDPARMDAALAKNPRLRHIQGSAFEFYPEEPVDWLFCDMAWRPLEVAQMLGRWGRRRQTRLLVANFKLPMKRKVEMVDRLRGVLAEQGFTGIRTRQLYHDREEITLTAHVR